MYHKINILKVNDIAVAEAMVLRLSTSPGFKTLVTVISSQIAFNILGSFKFILKIV